MTPLLPPRPIRRVLIDPAWLPIAACLAVVLAVMALVGAAVAPLARQRRLWRASMLALTYLWLDVSLLLGCLYLWARHRGAARRSATWTNAHCRLLTWALNRLRRAAETWADLRILVETDPAHEPPPGPVIVLSRHAGLGDSFTLVYLILTRYRRRPRVVLKSALQWDPGVDVILNRLSGCFLPSRTGSGDDLTDRLADTAAVMAPGDALLLFPEGRNWTPRRQRRVVRHLRRAGRHRAARRAETMRRVLPPRPAGTMACINARPDAHIVVVAHTGLDDVVTPRSAWSALPLAAPLRIAWWCVPPPVSADGGEWLDDQWSHVEQWIADRRYSPASERTQAPAAQGRSVLGTLTMRLKPSRRGAPRRWST